MCMASVFVPVGLYDLTLTLLKEKNKVLELQVDRVLPCENNRMSGNINSEITYLIPTDYFPILLVKHCIPAIINQTHYFYSCRAAFPWPQARACKQGLSGFFGLFTFVPSHNCIKVDKFLYTIVSSSITGH